MSPLWSLFFLLLLLLGGVGNSAMDLGSALARVMSAAATAAAATRSSVGCCCSVGSLLSWSHDKYIPFASVPIFMSLPEVNEGVEERIRASSNRSFIQLKNFC